jgi:hypothetical protein
VVLGGSEEQTQVTGLTCNNVKVCASSCKTPPMRTLSLLAVLSFLHVAQAQDHGPHAPDPAQDDASYAPGKVYFTGSGEWILSVPLLDVDGSEKGAVVRFSPFFNVQWMLNYDISRHFGLYTGLAVRNQGFIYQVPDTNVRSKYRTYDLGIPVGFKLGRMNHVLFYAGYGLELPFNYKEKRFENGKRVERFNVWFSDRNSTFYQSVFFGVQGPGGGTLTVRYYPTNFHNRDFSETIKGVTTQPYSHLRSNILAVSFGYALFDARKIGRHGRARKTDDVHSMR